VAWGAEELLVQANGNFTVGLYAPIAALAAANHVPAMYQNALPVTDHGGLMAFSVDFAAQWRRGADYVDKILRGASPADLPIEGARQFDFIVNVNAARALGITFPPDAAVQVTQWIQ
jgi:putative ABC transport system substrate-binding protein